jgi:hypothetical protein
MRVQHDEHEGSADGAVTRREVLRRGAVVGAATVWATPVVQAVGGRALAQGMGSPEPGSGGTGGDPGDGGDPGGGGDPAPPTPPVLLTSQCGFDNGETGASAELSERIGLRFEGSTAVMWNTSTREKRLNVTLVARTVGIVNTVTAPLRTAALAPAASADAPNAVVFDLPRDATETLTATDYFVSSGGRQVSDFVAAPNLGASRAGVAGRTSCSG